MLTATPLILATACRNSQLSCLFIKVVKFVSAYNVYPNNAAAIHSVTWLLHACIASNSCTQLLIDFVLCLSGDSQALFIYVTGESRHLLEQDLCPCLNTASISNDELCVNYVKCV